MDPILATSWGFGALVEIPSSTVLFDTGVNGTILLANMQRMNIKLTDVRSVAISHVHSDHLGGLKGCLTRNSAIRIYIPASLPDAVRRMIHGSGANFTNVTGPKQIASGIVTTGPLSDGVDEQALVVDTDEGLVVMTGCSHPGIARIVETVHAQQPDRPIAMVMGGFHLRSAGKANLEHILEVFRRLGVKKIAPSHCTGDQACSYFKKAYGPDFIEGGVGMVLNFDRRKVLDSE